MSDQTPDTTQDVTDGNEPSMEDILASIRKIIADDDMEDVKVDAVGVMNNEETREILKPILAEETLEAVPNDNVIDSDIEALLDGLGGEDLSLKSIDINPGDLEMTVPDLATDDSVLDLEIPFMEDPPLEAVVEEISAAPTPDDVPNLEATAEVPLSGEMDDDLNLMPDSLTVEENLDKPLVELAETAEPIATDELDQFLDDKIGDGSLDEDVEDLDLTPTQEDSDFELVKSLMADLTEKPYSPDEMVGDDDLDAPEVEIAESELSDSDEDNTLPEALEALMGDDDIEDEDSTDMMDEILNMTLYDEANLQESTIAAETELTLASDGEEITDLGISELEIPRPEQVDAPALSLQDIAKSAQSEATTLEASSGLAGLGTGLAIGTAAAGALSLPNAQSPATQSDDTFTATVPALQTPDDVDSLLSRLDSIIEVQEDALDDHLPEIAIDENIVDTIETPNPDTVTEENTPMPRAAKSETIIDEVTETATADAFASLNQAVEEKAVVAERGDRIGDLVMESLRPMLKEWLDANLKGIVERAVTKEVKRISSGK